MKRAIKFIIAVWCIAMIAQTAYAGGWDVKPEEPRSYDSLGIFVTRDNSGGDSTMTDTVTTWLVTNNGNEAGQPLNTVYGDYGGGTYTTLGIQAKLCAGSGLIPAIGKDSNDFYIVADQSWDKAVWFPVDSLTFAVADTVLRGDCKSVTLFPAPHLRIRSQGAAKLTDHRACSAVVQIYLVK